MIQDAINTWGEPVTGPGRYLSALSTRVWDVRYDGAGGEARARADIYFADSSMLKEIGNVCMGARAEVGLLQLAAPTTEEPYETVLPKLSHGERNSQPIRWTELQP